MNSNCSSALALAVFRIEDSSTHGTLPTSPDYIFDDPVVKKTINQPDDQKVLHDFDVSIRGLGVVSR